MTMRRGLQGPRHVEHIPSRSIADVHQCLARYLGYVDDGCYLMQDQSMPVGSGVQNIAKWNLDAVLAEQRAVVIRACIRAPLVMTIRAFSSRILMAAAER